MENTQATKPTEWDAMKLVHQALEHLESEEQTRVLSWAFDKFQIKLTPTSNVGQPAAGGAMGIDLTNPSLDVKNFINSKDPQGEVQRVLCLGAYLEQYKKQKDFINKEIEEANSEAKGFKFSNVSVPVKNATRSGYFNLATSKEAGRSTARNLSSLGERMVAVLPDQKAVAEVIKSYGKSRKSERKAKSTKPNDSVVN
jgi:hypothetical protein